MSARPWDEDVQLELFPEAGEPRRSPVQAPRPGLLPATEAETDPGEDFPGALQQAANRLLPGSDVEIRYTRNRTVILSLRPDRKGRSVLRAHQCFRDCPDSVANAAVRLYLSKARPSQRRRWSHIVTLYHQETATPPESTSSRTLIAGRDHDLRAILGRVNATWFDGELNLDITFGDRVARRLMGRHERRSPRNLIVINPLLDHHWVTAWYLEFLVFHECLHEIFPPRPKGDRMILHPPEFREREQQHPDFEKARKYERWLTGTAWRRLKDAYLNRKSSPRMNADTENAQIKPARSRPGTAASGGGDP